MVAQTFSLIVEQCDFFENIVLPHLDIYPRTYSGFGGAMFIQSASVTIMDSNFTRNYALTGQFDAGSAGGAIVLENASPVVIKSTYFGYNGASGFIGYSTFSQPGTAGAIYIKFSSANISHHCVFEFNWASAGGSAPGVGGALASKFFESVVEQHNILIT